MPESCGLDLMTLPIIAGLRGTIFLSTEDSLRLRHFQDPNRVRMPM